MIFATLKTVFSDYVIQKFIEKKTHYDYYRGAVFGSFGVVYLGVIQWWIYVDLFNWIWPDSTAFGNRDWSYKLSIFTSTGWNDPVIRKGWMDAFGMTLIDNFGHNPFLYLPAFYFTKNLVQVSPGQRVEVEDDKNPPVSFNQTVSVNTPRGTGNRVETNRVNTTVTSTRILHVEGSLLERTYNQWRANVWEDIKLSWWLWVPADMWVHTVPLWQRMPANHLVSFVWTGILSGMRGAEILAIDCIEEERAGSSTDYVNTSN